MEEDGNKFKYNITSHPQTNGQAKVTNKTLGDILTALIKSNCLGLGCLTSHAKFSYNIKPSKPTGMSPFKVVYGANPLSPLDVVQRH